MDRVVHTDVAAEGELKQLLRPGVAFFLRYSLGDRKPLKGPVEEVLSLAVLGVQTQKLIDAPELLTFVVQTAKHCLDAPSKDAADQGSPYPRSRHEQSLGSDVPHGA